MGDEMIVGIHQPNFLPWLGYFHKMKRCDVFVLLDAAQYTKGGYINRVRIKTPQGARWLTVPVLTKDRHGQAVMDVEMSDAFIREKHLNAFKAYYGRAKHFNDIIIGLSAVYGERSRVRLCDFNTALIEWAAARLGIKTRMIRASSLKPEGGGTDLLVDIAGKLNGDVYLSGSGGAKYQDEDAFRRAGITLEYCRFEHPVYEQQWGDFLPGMSVVDMLFNLGPGCAGMI